ncbi:MAG: DUF951 domain-containing protein [Anaerolineae bacterium]|nr:DUF951 domain-containing protein [Anaerolineae bacterium]
MNHDELLSPLPGDHVEMRKAHPCGSREWVVYRIGADIGLRCAGCNRRVMMPRSEFNKSARRLWRVQPGQGGIS